jgi:hypothetical protein
VVAKGTLKAACLEAAEAAASIDALVRDKLLKRVRKQGIVSQDEAIELVEAWRHAARDPRKRKKHHKRTV